MNLKMSRGGLAMWRKFPCDIEMQIKSNMPENKHSIPSAETTHQFLPDRFCFFFLCLFENVCFWFLVCINVSPIFFFFIDLIADWISRITHIALFLYLCTHDASHSISFSLNGYNIFLYAFQQQQQQQQSKKVMKREKRESWAIVAQ